MVIYMKYKCVVNNLNYCINYKIFNHNYSNTKFDGTLINSLHKEGKIPNLKIARYICRQWRIAQTLNHYYNDPNVKHNLRIELYN